MSNIKGYIFSRPFFNERVPQHIQNIILRDYCKKNSINLLLSSTEYSVKGSTHILEEIVRNLPKYNGIVFYSFLQLPENIKKRRLLYLKILKNNKELHFAAEGIKVRTVKQFSDLEQLYLIKTSSFQDKKIILGKEKFFLSPYHNRTQRNFLDRMNLKKVNHMKISKKFGFDYWDGDRKYGYGGYKYIKNYFKPLALKLIKSYNLNENSSVLDLGCGKGFLIYEIKNILKNIKVTGVDISKYAKSNSKKEVIRYIKIGDIQKKLKFPNKSFDLVLCINTLHNFALPQIEICLNEIERVGLSKFICVESYRNDREQFNLQCWALTAKTIIDTNAWKWIFKINQYSGDYEFIYFK